MYLPWAGSQERRQDSEERAGGVKELGCFVSAYKLHLVAKRLYKGRPIRSPQNSQAIMSHQVLPLSKCTVQAHAQPLRCVVCDKGISV